MANTFTNLAADAFKAADVVGRELVGFIPSITINANGSERVAKGDVIRASFTRSASAVDVSEAMTIPEGTDQTVDNKTLTINNSRAVQIPYTGEDVLHLNNGIGFQTVYGDQILQAMRALANEIEADLAQEAYQNASRAVGTAGTTPFGSNFDLLADARRILVDNGMPTNDGQCTFVMDTAAGSNLRKLAQLQKANEAGGTNLLRQGTLLDLQGMMIKESAQVQSHTKGTGASKLVNGAGAVGDTIITTDGGSGTILAGDIVTFAADSDNSYVVNTALATGTFAIGSPGLRAVIADNNAITVGNNYTANIALHRQAMELAVRAPAVPDGGDAAVESETVTDPTSGLTFEIRMYKGYRKTMIEVATAWGYKAWKPDFIATVMG
jgi:hypothetical protein